MAIEPSAIQALAPSSLRSGFQVQVSGASGENAEEIALKLTGLLEGLGRQFDLSRLDGSTFAIDYPLALRELVRGYEGTQQLAPSQGRVVGVAMTPTVIRDGELRSHLLVDANVFFGMLHDGRAERAIHLLAHECAHVEINAHYDRCFPDTLLRQRLTSIQESTRSGIILACWDEYAACARSAKYGENPAAEYEQTFVTHLSDARERANEFIKAYRLHRQVGQIIAEVSEVYGSLMKYAAYYLGNLAGLGNHWRDTPAIVDALEGHWFSAYFIRLADALAKLYAEIGTWANRDDFEVIGDIAEDLIREGGMFFYDSPTHPGEVGVSLPITPETVPY